MPKFQTNAIDALIKPAAATTTTTTPKVSSSSTCGTTTGSAPSWQSGTTTTRNSWIQPSPSSNTNTVARQQQQQQQRPTSWYVGQQPLPMYDPAPSAPFLSPPPPPQQTTTTTTNTTTTSNDRSPFNQDNKQYAAAGLNSWSQQLPPSQQPMSHSSTTTISGKSTNNEQKHQYTHSRSRSVPYSVPQPATAQSMTQQTPSTSVFKFDTVAATPSKQQQQQRPAPLTSRVSMDADSFQRLSSAIDTGQSLLLTKKFVPPKASNNPFESAIDESPKHESSSAAAAKYSPFADDLDNQSTPRASMSSSYHHQPPPAQENQQQQQEEKASAPPWPSINRHPNKQNIYPPPVPSQATKPAFPKYARNIQPSLALRRTQSYRSSDAATATAAATLDPFNVADPQSTPTLIHHHHHHTTTNTTSNTPPIAFSHGNKLFRHRSYGSALMRR